MSRFPSPFGGDDADDLFDDQGAFVPEHIPDPGPFLEGHDVLVDDAHTAFHAVARECFEERGVYDMTFNYNLARLNLDTRHTEAGYRYAEEAGDPAVLRAEFTPTTPFCPQSKSLTVGSFRAWNALVDRHDYDLVRVRVHPMHHSADSINDHLQALEDAYEETGEVTELPDDGPSVGSNPMERSRQAEDPSRGTDAPF